MTEFFGSVWWLIVTLGLLVTFHEFGHFWVARRFGVKVLRFSVGFGRPLWSRFGAGGTEYVVAAIPLGGYVKFLDEREGEVAPAEAEQAFNRKSLGARAAIVAAGPVFNLVFAVIAFWAMFTIGKPDYLPLVGRAEGIAAAAGFEPGDRITAVGGERVSTWTDTTLLLVRHALDRVPVAVEVMDRHAMPRTRTLDLATVGGDGSPSLRHIGLLPQQFMLPPVIGKVTPDGPADRAGLRAGDRIVALAGRPIDAWDGLQRVMQEQGTAGQPVEVVVERNGERIRLTPSPERRVLDDGRSMTVIGIEVAAATAEYDAVLQFGPLEAVPAAFAETWRMTRETIGILVRMVTGQASLKNLSGPISIAQFANASAQLGLAWFLFFLGLLSLSLGILNLLPIPILDGGHLLYYLIEWVKGRPLSERAMVAGQYVGLALLAGLIGLAFYNDILRLLS